MQDNLLGEYLIKKGIITDSQLREANEEQARTNRKLSEIILKRGLAEEKDIARAFSEQLGYAYMDLSFYQVETEAVALISAGAVRRLEVMPLFKLGDSLTVAMSNPLDVNIIDELTRLSGGLRIRPIIATTSEINAAIDKYYGRQDNPASGISINKMESKADVTGLMHVAAQAPVVNLVNRLIEDAVRSGASDIHLEPQNNVLYCRFRIDGILREMEALPGNLALAILSRVKVMAEIDIAQNRIPQDGRFQKEVFGRDIDLRVATFPTIYGEHISIRILDKTQGLLKLEELGFLENAYSAFKEIIYKPYGLILVTGPTGSGKTTTLYSILNTINNVKKNIVTLEDPIEYTIPRVNQSQVNVKAGLTFASGLRSILRLDPDTIMIGEIRDKETADIAIQSSLTGHLVFSTLHTNDAASAAARLIDIGVEPYLLSSSLLGVLAQRLVRKLCSSCRIEYKPTEEELAVIGARISNNAVFYKPGGCAECKNAGYKGRIGIFELLIPNEHIKEIINVKSPAYEIKSAACRAGMLTLREEGLEKAAKGITSISEILRVTEEV